MVQLNYRDARPIYSQITDGFRQQIMAGVLQEGDKLPSVRDLASQLAINPNTIQRAYRELENDGWIATVPGKGCFVCGKSSNGQEAELWKAFEKTVEALKALGVSSQTLISHIEGGSKDA